MTSVLMLPAGQDVGQNPYTFLLRRGLEELGVQVRGGDTRTNLLKKADAVHVHWPHNYADSGTLLYAIARSALLLILCAYHRAQGSRLVWTVHDLHSFQQRRPKFEAVVMNLFRRLTTSLVFLNGSSQGALYTANPEMRSRDWRLVPHGLYGDRYPEKVTKAEARRELGLTREKTIVLCPGDLKPYKNTEAVIAAISATRRQDLCLVIAGRCDPPSYESEIGAQIEEAQHAGADIVWLNERHDANGLARAMDASDAIVLPYSTSWNSGMAILSLERRRPIICSSASAFADLWKSTSDYWVRMAPSHDYHRLLSDFQCAPPSPADEQRLANFAADRDWTHIANETLSLYTRSRRASA